ncbi:MAG: DM13 domain-containing protein [Ilumatobacter sp.]|uniref:DM13 domain-containing protein n=1 Tax=Ilumatobacter sp. TaxID=1967498 RepID=UPI00262EDB86|nr:DM13 domain-containing protein [Ilumatobacter sp.]MDJ0769503.1 DM13 domain-containing protein [Ilumatobacter sp.]
MLAWIRSNLKIAVPVAVVGAAVVAFLAFGVFGVHTLFIDDVVDEDVPVFASGLGGDAIDEQMRAEMDAAMEAEGTDVDVEMDEDTPMPEAQDEATEDDAMEIFTVASGEFIGRSHPGEGQALVLNDGSEQRFLRFENFETDNGPDLNVFLVAGASADADAGLFDDDFVDLGDLKGNIGPQNYEIPVDVDLDRYNTVVVWCVRFGVAFTAADLA